MSLTWRPGGNRNPVQRLGLRIARNRLSEKLTASSYTQEDEKPDTVIARILDLARWAPSGDNTQPWRFETTDERHFLILAQDTRDWCVYDLDGRASQTAVGALLETIAIAASGEGLASAFSRKQASPETNPVIEVTLSKLSDPEPDPLLPFIRARVTQRRPLSTTPLTTRQKIIMEESVGASYRIIWIEGWAQKWWMARLLFQNAGIRLTIPEAYEVHKRIIQWDAQYSEDRIPDQAVGLDTVTLKLMRWAMQSWKRVQMMNRYFAGTLMPRIQLDLIPALRCAAHFMIISEKPLESIENYLEGGRALQRFWLTSTSLGLQFQPEMTPLIFSRYHALSENFTQDAHAIRLAGDLASRLSLSVGEKELANAVFMGRLGTGRVPGARSVRRSIKKQLLVDRR
ncbi:MAG TPA: molybdopterin biosynthesis protein MoeY [Gammaproteobacteria bacterium]|nr:molybdopterin biosynthesis protein MoeY [Gammaproteobacteria bacterium]